MLTDIILWGEEDLNFHHTSKNVPTTVILCTL